MASPPPQARPPRPRKISGRALAGFSFLAGFIFHGVAALGIWRGWSPGTRSAWLVYMDFPLSLLWADLPGSRVLLVSLLAGGLWWGLITVLLAGGVGRLTAGGRG